MGKNTAEIASCTGGLEIKYHNNTEFRRIDLKDNLKSVPHAKLVYTDSGDIIFHVDNWTTKAVYRNTFAKSHIYEMIKMHLGIRPIKVHNIKTELKLHPKIKAVKYNDLDDYSVEELQYQYNRAVDHLHGVMKFSTGEQLKKAQWQLTRLLERQHKIDVLETIQYSMKAPFKSQYR